MKRSFKDGINNVTWYKMYEGQKAYKDAILTTSTTTSSMIWGSQWDQIMIWMKDVPSVFRNDTYTGKFYITNAVGMGNYGVANSDDYDDTANPAPTGCYDVKNIYDLAGNVYDWMRDIRNGYRFTMQINKEDIKKRYKKFFQKLVIFHNIDIILYRHKQ